MNIHATLICTYIFCSEFSSGCEFLFSTDAGKGIQLDLTAKVIDSESIQIVALIRNVIQIKYIRYHIQEYTLLPRTQETLCTPRESIHSIT